MSAEPILLAHRGDVDVHVLPQMANRHGLVTGATGTGKTVTLQTLAEAFSRQGVPVFLADVKGDLAGITQPRSPNAKMEAVLKERGIEPMAPEGFPTTFWDVYADGKAASGHPVRATVSDMGPLLLARMLSLNETQGGVLQIVFKIADDQGLALLDLKDLRAMLQHVGDNAATFKTEYGNVSPASIGAIQRGLLQIGEQGGERFFGEPMLDIADFMQTTGGKGIVNILAADKLLTSPRLYATFLLWMLSELFEALPEVGDLEKPKLVFFFDEAHLLFDEAPKALVERIELVVRLIRSKGVGVWFVTQNPLDIPDSVLAQLGNRVQHALRAYTPRDQKAVKATATTMRPNPPLDIEAAITELAVGEALVSVLDAKGRPSPTERVYVLPPASRLGAITPDERRAVIDGSLVAGAYEKTIDRESAYEKLKGRAETSQDAATTLRNAPEGSAAGGGVMGGLRDMLFGSTGPRGGRHDGLAQTAAKSAIRTIGSSVGREIVRGVLGGLLGVAGGGEPRRPAASMTQIGLFADAPAGTVEGPAGWRYRADFVDAPEEAALLAAIAGLALHEATYKGYTARRRVAHFGTSDGFGDDRLLAAPPLPPALEALRARAADWIGAPATALSSALVSEYRSGVQLGWHRDMPDFETVVGISLLGSARMRFRRYPPGRPAGGDSLAVELAPRSAYVLRGDARWGWQHSVAPTPGQRYSITFRTRRG